MKTTLIAALLLLGSISMHAGLPQTKLNTKIEAVTVYLNGATITRSGSSTLEAGLKEILISGLSPDIQPSSIQVGGTGDFILLSVSHRINYLQSKTPSKEIRSLQDSLERLNRELSIENSMLYVYQQEEKMLNANQSIGGQEKGVDVQQLMTAVDYYRKRMTEVKKLQIDVSTKITDLRESINRITNQLEGMQEVDPPVGEIIMLVQASAKTTANFTVSYLVNAASWVPTYDIRVKDTKTSPNILFKATLQQSCGEDWKDVKLTLSTADPSLSNTLPMLNPWYISNQRPIKYKSYRSANVGVYDSLEKAPVAMYEVTIAANGGARKMESASSYTQTVDAATNIEYQISLPYSLEASGKELTIEVATYTLEAEYTYYCVPKIDKDAFLKARVTGWEKYNILPGSSNIFFEGTLVGMAEINAQYASDTLELSLGRDKRIIIERTEVKDVSSKSIIGASKKETHIYEIKIRNNKKEDINLVIEDQIPISKSTDIEVSKLEDSGARYDAESGKLSWNLKLASAEVKALRFGFGVKYPKDAVVYIR